MKKAYVGIAAISLFMVPAPALADDPTVVHGTCSSINATMSSFPGAVAFIIRFFGGGVFYGDYQSGCGINGI